MGNVLTQYLTHISLSGLKPRTRGPGNPWLQVASGNHCLSFSSSRKRTPAPVGQQVLTVPHPSDTALDTGGRVSEGGLAQIYTLHSWSSPSPPVLGIPPLKKLVPLTFRLGNRGSQKASHSLKAASEFVPRRAQWISSPHNFHYAGSSYNNLLFLD